MKLHLGCGKLIRADWLNIDLKHGDIKCDLSKGIPVGDAKASHVFHEHFLEHLDYPVEAEEFLGECSRVLADRGVLRIGVPDTEYSIRAYIEKNAGYFSECREKWHPSYCTTMMESLNYHFRQAGQHKFVYDFETLEKILLNVGFQDVTRQQAEDSVELGFDIDSRIDPGTLFVNCVKYS